MTWNGYLQCLLLTAGIVGGVALTIFVVWHYVEILTEMHRSERRWWHYLYLWAIPLVLTLGVAFVACWVGGPK